MRHKLDCYLAFDLHSLYPASYHRSASFVSGWKNQNRICDIERTYNSSVGGKSVATMSRERPYNSRSSRGEYVTRVSRHNFCRWCYPASEAKQHEPNAGMQLLASVRYFLSSSLPQDRQDDLRQVLDCNEATPAATLKDATHIISITNSHRFEG